ncbi:dethiobiotin synthase [Flavobacterium aquatile]|uniref:ATP-dependent dethiobiotin synthetase BioD n=1 Tax=Flavobacterium aquatile LMG 4008 = ATCC 11947 TaxID=1453498 RepID=A0A095SX87_9FLAO|nr:dethiobiotin synthase [Flavobacterium aquatile]KGD68969.1 ATP-dependent dethiobiotin synthetase BioD [Flavobacterium aquatile LMG 4008 = ATCC 11947]OXA65680.1 dethiobiotin synthase [Flavobacterium aquatile] [Flavobacterium aquatile LMG 4008 = ATCC 11947]GEC79618.1 ATP-dependent dethiobiotin synthetase BioD [Flavobacterium aquatile]
MKLFITGIGTDVGKTITSAIITQALEADYWKPVQAGDLDNSDSHKIQRYISNDKTVIHENSYKLNTPASPHLAAKLDGITIDLKRIIEPKTKNYLVIEGAGGLLVPLNDNDSIIDLIKEDYKIILVSRHYLGSINHTLLSFEILKSRNLEVAGIIFSGDENQASEEIILNKTKAKFIGRIDDEPYFDQNVIQYYADLFRENLLAL